MMGDMLAAFLVATSHVWLWISTASIADHFGLGRQTSLRITAQLIIVWSAIVASSFLLSTTGLLAAWSLYGCVLAIITLTWWLCSRQQQSADLTHRYKSKLPVDIRLRFGLQILAAIGIAQLICFGLVELPVDWDSLAYHLPLVDHWIQSGDLANQQCAFWHVPGNNELIGFWLAAPFSGDFWVQLNNAPVIILLVSSLLAIGNHLRLGPWAKFVLVAVAVGCQPVLRQLVSAENDIAVTALLMAALLFGQRYVRWSKSVDLALFAASVGLLCGIKYYAIGYAALAVLITLIGPWPRRGLTHASLVLICSLFGFLACGAYWYARNYMLTGSPLFPVGMERLGIPDQWKAMRPESERSTLLLGSTSEVWRMLLWAWTAQAGPMLTAVTLLGPLCAAAGPSLLQDRRSRWLPIAVAFAIAIYFVTPNVIETVSGSRNMLILQYHPVRFGFALSTLSTVLFVTLAYRLSVFLRSQGRVRLWHAIAGFGGLAAATGTVWALLPQYGLRKTVLDWGFHAWRFPHLDYHPLVWLSVTICSFMIIVVGRRIWTSGSLYRCAGAVVVSAAFIAATPVLASRWHRGFNSHYQQVLRRDVDWRIRELAGDDPFAVCEYRYYPSIGSYRQGSPYRPLFLPDYAAFAEFLKANEISLVATPRQDEHWSRTYRNVNFWMKNRPFAYELIHEHRSFRIFRVKSPGH